MDEPPDADRFGVAIHRTDAELRFLVRIPSEISSAWQDPNAFQSLVESLVWDRLDRQATLESIVRHTEPDETVSLGSITIQPDGTVVDAALDTPFGDG